MRTTKIFSLSLPLELLKEAEHLAKREGKTKSELCREALRQYIQAQKWRELQAYGTRRSKQLGIRETDVERLIDEYRRGI